MFPFKANAFSFVVNNNADAIKANFKKRIDSYWLLEPHGRTRWVGKIKKNTITLQKQHVSGRGFYPVIIFTLEEMTGNITQVSGYFCISLFKWFSLLTVLTIVIYTLRELSLNLIFYVMAGLIFSTFTFLYFFFLFSHKMWIRELEMIMVADTGK